MECKGFVLVNNFFGVVGELGGGHARGGSSFSLLEQRLLHKRKLTLQLMKRSFSYSVGLLPCWASAIVGMSCVILTVTRCVAVVHCK